MPATTASLERLIADLSDPAAYPHPAESIQVVHTHISCVFLTGDYAYKIKKPVDFGFLDYRILSRRRVFCEQDLILNRRLCPDLYLNVVPVTLQDGRLAVGGRGAVVEWAVQMRQLRLEEMLSERLAAQTACAIEIQRIADVLAGFHARAASRPDIRSWGAVGVVAHTVFSCLATMETLSASPGSIHASTAIQQYLASFLTTDPALFSRRADEGCVRDCHGDLRTQNICLDPRFDSGVQVFDCIEFNQEFRYIDVAADLGYLAMDLDLAGRPDLRKALIDAYLGARPDSSLWRILPFYMTYRACVRGNIALLAAAEPEIPEDQRQAHHAVAAAAYDLARCYACRRGRPALMITTGLSGSGKSSLARELSRRLPAIVLSSDQVRKERAGVARTDRLDDSRYTPAERAETYAELNRRAEAWLSQGEHVILDATFLSAGERGAARQLAAACGAEFWTLDLRCPDAVIRRRLALRRASQADASDAGLAVYERQLRSYAPIEPSRSDAASLGHHLVIETDRPAPEAAAEAVGRFASPQ
ncbi:MAG TPA: AAA family ATPase [Chthonomonadaceae bacterium]|nr:AAA family ATPase [Chthonomonadaceae bacterium]